MTDGLPVDIPDDLIWQRAAPDEATGPGPWIEIAFGDGDLVFLREASSPDTVVTTTQEKWNAFALGVQAGEFDHFADGA
ncbi:DUF397 domain-containing protein [Streptomyces sp. NBC_00006]|uniref:DUF397 domain-containing protein n=1 Tax=unclassified Streptomyces TaxID=2593676 RepID=UPI0022510103|nr:MULTISPECIES: DUF397 domain-containing protein [unclassified Streptomyces]MCX4832500.1 DUF397 domain-containing protein [Streptomyces sp. NBC_01016]MCX5533486.1 DUF397 domain-containing protein [Streptomyces sp. NBC_00006]